MVALEELWRGGQSVGGQLLFLRGWMDGDSSLCGFGPGSPPPPLRGHEHGATSALMLPGRQRLFKKSLRDFFVPYGFSGISTLAGHPHSAGGQVCFPELGGGAMRGTGCGIRRQIPVFNARVSSIRPFCLGTDFCYPTPIHPRATPSPQTSLPTLTLTPARLSHDLLMVQPLLKPQNPESECSTVRSKEAICDALILLFLSHGRFKGAL